MQTTHHQNNNNTTNEHWRRLYYHVKLYGKRTTIHGLSHMYSTRDKHRRLFWMITFVLGFVATIVHLVFHTRQFLESPTVITLNHKEVNFEFPDVTLCSQTPTTGNFYPRQTHHYPNIKHGLTVQDWLLLPLFNVTSYQQYNELNYQNAVKLHHFIIQQQMCSTPTKHKGMQLEEMVITCQYQGHDCKTHFELIQDRHYINCYTFKPTNREQNSNYPEDGLVLLLYTGNKPISTIDTGTNSNNDIVNSSSRNSVSNDKKLTDWFARILIPGLEPPGIKVIINEKGKLPKTRSSGIIVGTGHFAEVELGMVQEESLNRSHSPCQEHNPTEAYWIGVDDNNSKQFKHFDSTVDDCEGHKKQQLVLNLCKCFSHYLPLHKTNSDYFLCYNSTQVLQTLGMSTLKMTNWSTDNIIEFGKNKLRNNKIYRQHFLTYLERVQCHDSVIKNFSDPHFKIDAMDCDKTANSCVKDVYTWQHSSAVWPRDSDIQEIIEESILPSILPIKDSSQHADIVNDLFQFDPNGKWWTYKKVIKENFVKLQLHANEIKSDVHREEYAYSVWEALGELGGIVGLWLGMSFLGVVELAEFAAGIVVSMVRSKQDDQQVADPQQEEVPLTHSQINNGISVHS